MFLHRLGRAFGIINIDALDDAITEEQLLEHQAAFWIDGLYHGRNQTSEVVAEIRNLGNRVVAVQSTNPKEVADSMTWHSSHSIIDQQTKTDESSKAKTMIPANEAFAEIELRYG